MKKPVKKKSKAVARREEIANLMDPKAGRKFERDAENALIDLEEQIEPNYKHAWSVFQLQDNATRKAILQMVEMMQRMAGEPVFRFRGVVLNADFARLNEIQERSLLISAVRLFTACALWDIQLGNFKLPEHNCARCGKEVN